MCVCIQPTSPSTSRPRASSPLSSPSAVCLRLYICIHTYTHTHTYLYTYLYIYVYVHLFTYIYQIAILRGTEDVVVPLVNGLRAVPDLGDDYITTTYRGLHYDKDDSTTTRMTTC